MAVAAAVLGAGYLNRRPTVAVAIANPSMPTASASSPPSVPAPPVSATRPPGEDLSPGRYHELPDTGGYVIHLAVPGPSEGSASSVGSGPERLRFAVTITDHGPQGTIGASLVNVSGRTMRFAKGCRVVAEVSLDGKPWRTFDLVDPSVTELSPGQQASMETSFDFDGPGQYSAWGSTDIELAAS